MKKHALATAMGAALAISASTASALSVSTWQLNDYDNDGLSSDFAFYAAPTGSSGNVFATGPTGDGGPIAMDTGEIGTNVFTTGFNFNGTGVFAPFIGNAAGTGNISADITGGVLTFGDLDFGGNFGANFYLPPDSAPTIETITDLGGGDFGVVVRYIGTIPATAASFPGWASNWRLEGVMTVVPVPAAVWLFGSGLLGLVGIARRKKKA